MSGINYLKKGSYISILFEMNNKFLLISFAFFAALRLTAQNPTGKNEQELDVRFYPNPAVDHIIVHTDRSFVNPLFELNSIIGNKIVLNLENLGNGEYRIPLENFASGYYFLIIRDEEKKVKVALKFLKN